MKKFLALTAVCLLAFTMACESGSPAPNNPLEPTEEAKNMFDAVKGGIEATSDEVKTLAMSMTGSKSKAGYEIEWYDNDNPELSSIHAYGDYSYDSDEYLTLNLTIDFDQYDSDDIKITGKTTYVYNETATGYRYTVSGDLTVNYEGEDYDFSWDMQMTVNGNLWESTGTFTINGDTYTCSEGGGSATDTPGEVEKHGAINEAVDEVIMDLRWYISDQASYQYTVFENQKFNWTNEAGTVSATGTWTMNDLDSDDVDIDITITYNEYFSEYYGATVTGSTTYQYSGSQTNFTYTVVGNFDVTYEGTDYDFSWDKTTSRADGTYLFSGSFTVDGNVYTISGSGVAKK